MEKYTYKDLESSKRELYIDMYYFLYVNHNIESDTFLNVLYVSL